MHPTEEENQMMNRRRDKAFGNETALENIEIQTFLLTSMYRLIN